MVTIFRSSNDCDPVSTLPNWTQKTSVTSLLELDVLKDSLPRNGCLVIGPGVLGSAPGWLRSDLPCRPSPAPDASPVDLALPLECNPFYREMGDDLVTQLRALTASYAHCLLLGCSGKYTSNNVWRNT